MKKILPFVLSISILAGICPILNFTVNSSATDISEMNVGDIIEFGSYPQSRVDDETLISSFATVEKNWISYDYYWGTANNTRMASARDGSMVKSDYMKYSDFEYNGEKYRAVYIYRNRPYDTGIYIKEDEYPVWAHNVTNSSQDDNGYYYESTYYFKYDPIKWRVLDPDDGLVMCNNVIDTQTFNGYVYFDGEEYYSSKECTDFASDYATSEIREWLNNDFYFTAFSGNEKYEIKKSYIETAGHNDSKYDSTPTNDKIFLLSREEALTSAYGFSSDNQEMDDAKKLTSTEYARCQGCYVTVKEGSKSNGCSSWMLRTAVDSFKNSNIQFTGFGNNSYASTYVNESGVVPAFRFKQTDETDFSCGENAQWSFSDGTLSITGTGSVDFADEYRWELYNDDIEYIEINSGITFLPDGIFSNLPKLTEIHFGKSIETIGSGAFNGCFALLNVSFMGNTKIGSGSFAGANSSLMFVFGEGSSNPNTFAKNNNIKSLIVSYDEKNKTLCFNGGIDVKDSLSYAFLNEFLFENKESEYVFFDKLDFHNIVPEQFIITDDEINAKINNTDLSLHNIYVSLSVVDADGKHQISFSKMLELLESGDYDAFKLKIKSDEEETEKSFFEKVAESVGEFFTSALKAISKVINFITKIFKK